MKLKFIKTLKYICILYLVLVSMSFILSIVLQFPSFEEVGHLTIGCYWTDALVPYIECRGLILNKIIKIFLNLWMYIIYIGMFSVYSFRAAIFFLLLCSPIIFLVWHWYKERHIAK